MVLAYPAASAMLEFLQREAAAAAPSPRTTAISTHSLDPKAVAELVNAARRGEAHALEALARAYLRPAYSVALAILRRPADAEDAAHDALLTAFERLDSCREPARFAAWFMTIVRNHSKNQLTRRKLRDVPDEDTDFDPGTTHGAPQLGVLRSRLLRALGQLSPVEREVVLLHDLEGLTHPEIADLLDVSCVMSRQHLFVSRRKLRHFLGDELDDGDSP
ncbi:MAG TPA: sigma-70 family RNA polymerase sigma factor [Polyangiaceae bacterium]|nr:sigma-70 family RNA polymerase sigma factor [Polyangiaceae bacterium]